MSLLHVMDERGSLDDMRTHPVFHCGLCWLPVAKLKADDVPGVACNPDANLVARYSTVLLAIRLQHNVWVANLVIGLVKLAFL